MRHPSWQWLSFAWVGNYIFGTVCSAKLSVLVSDGSWVQYVHVVQMKRDAVANTVYEAVPNPSEYKYYFRLFLWFTVTKKSIFVGLWRVFWSVSELNRNVSWKQNYPRIRDATSAVGLLEPRLWYLQVSIVLLSKWPRSPLNSSQASISTSNECPGRRFCTHTVLDSTLNTWGVASSERCIMIFNISASIPCV